MPGIRYPLMINGVAVVSAPAEIDVTTAGQLRMVLLDAGRHGHVTVVVDMTRTRFCDSAGLAVLAGAHRRALAHGGGLRLVLPARGTVARILSFTGLDGFIPGFGRLEQGLGPGAWRRDPVTPRVSPRAAQPGASARPRGAAEVSWRPMQARLELSDRRTRHTQPGYPAISGYRASWGPGWTLRLPGGRACRSRLTDRR